MWVLNENLQLALDFLKKEQFKEAVAKLNQACEEKDGLACFLKAEAILLGGWGDILLDEEYGDKYYFTKSTEYGCVYGCMDWNRYVRSEDLYIKGSLKLLYGIFDEVGISEVKEAAKQGNFIASSYLINCKWISLHERRLFCKQALESAYIERSVLDKERLPEDIQFLLGQYMYNKKFKIGHHFVAIYKKSTERARLAALYFVWIKCLHKDINRYIGKMIYASRYDPGLWI